MGVEGAGEPEKAEKAEKAGKGPRKKTCRSEWKPRKDGWTKAKRRIFLETLAATCVARWAARAAGMSYSAASALRSRDPAFAEAWQKARVDSFYTMESLVMEHAVLAKRRGAGEGGEADSFEPGDLPDASTMDPELAMKLMKQREGMLAAEAAGKIGRPPLKVATEAETDAAILKKLAALRKQLGLDPDGDQW
jgi:hypothetical protein